MPKLVFAAVAFTMVCALPDRFGGGGEEGGGKRQREKEKGSLAKASGSSSGCKLEGSDKKCVVYKHKPRTHRLHVWYTQN